MKGSIQRRLTVAINWSAARIGSLDDLVLAFRDSLAQGGWLDAAGTAEDADGVVHESVMEMLLVADRYPSGTVIGTNLGAQYVRQPAPAR